MKISEIEKKDFVIREAKWQIIEKISAAVASSVKSWLSIIILASKKKPSNKMWGQTLWYFHLGRPSKISCIFYDNLPKSGYIANLKHDFFLIKRNYDKRVGARIIS